MKLLSDIFRNCFVVYSYFLAVTLGEVGAGDKTAIQAMHIAATFTATNGIFWLLVRFLYKRGYRVALVWTKEAA